MVGEEVGLRRLLALVAVVALTLLAASQAAPAPREEPAFGGTQPPEPEGAVSKSSVWYCSWVDSGGVRDSIYGVASVVDVDVTISLPSPVPNEPPDTFDFDIVGPGARGIDTSVIVRRGEAPGIVEFGDGPASAATVMWADALASGDRCVVSVPKLWHLPGGTTRIGAFLSLRLFNPFPENAKVTVNAVSEFGNVPLPELEGFDVPGRTWRTIDLSQTIPLFDDVAVTVSTSQGIVIPSLVLADSAGEASWPGTGLSTTWEFPVAVDGGLAPFVAVSNTGGVAAEVVVDIFTPDGPIPDAAARTVEPGTPLRISLGEFAAPPFGVRVRSSVPIAAVVQGTELVATDADEGDEEAAPPDAPADEAAPDEAAPDEAAPDEAAPDGEVAVAEEEAPIRGLAGTVGAIEPARRWMLPAVGLVPETTATIWVMNTGGSPATLTVTPLGDESETPDKVRVEPGSVLGLPVGSPLVTGASGYSIDATEPVSVAWSLAGPRGVAYVAGVASG
jgi:hypothetical protein